MTRTEFLAILLKIYCYDIEINPSTLPFTDIDNTIWQANVVYTGLKNDIINGDYLTGDTVVFDRNVFKDS
jgi:hypothetical protein